MQWLRRSAFGLAIAAALAFGGYQALGSTGMDPEDCVYNPPDMGWCAGPGGCQQMCDAYYGPGSAIGFCEYVGDPVYEWCCICIEI